jgi:CubicO group peptidase (beta-lactamase class C family)
MGKKYSTAIILGLFILGFASISAAQQPQSSQVLSVEESEYGPGLYDVAEFEAFVDGIMRIHMVDKHIAGATFAAVKEGEIFFTKGYGFADVSVKKPVRADRTLFRPGSVSKLITWTAVMQLVEQGKIDLDMDVNTYLKEFKIPEAFEKPITMANLMTHTSGFEESFAVFTDKVENLKPMREHLAKNVPARIYPPGDIAAYSNYGSALAGYIVEIISGVSFEEYVEQNIFLPLGMNHSTFRQPLPEQIQEHMSVGYVYGQGDFTEREFELIGGMAPAGAMSTTAEDMARFMIAHLQLGRFGDIRILEEGTARQMQSRLFAHDNRIAGNAHGFWEWIYNGHRGIEHGGDTLLFHSDLVIVPELQVGFFVSYNSIGGGGAPRGQLLRAIFDRYFPAPDSEPLEVPEGFKKKARRFTGTYGSARTFVTSFAKLGQLFSTVKVAVSKEGGLMIPAGANAKPYVEIAPLLYREKKGQNLVAFREDSRGRITHMFLGRSPHAAFIKRAWHETTLFHVPVLGIIILIFLSILVWPIGALRRKLCRTSYQGSQAPKTARWLASGMSMLCLIFLVGCAILLSNLNQYFMTGIPLAFKILLVLPLVAAVLAVGVLVFTCLGWWKSYWIGCSRVHYTLVLLAFVVFLWFLYYWNMLGFQF